MKREHIYLAVATVLIICSLYVIYSKQKDDSSPTMPEQEVTQQETSDLAEFRNGKYNFSFKIPGALIPVTQSDSDERSEYLFIDQTVYSEIESDPTFFDNPLSIILGQGYPALYLSVTPSSLVQSDSVEDLKTLATEANTTDGDTSSAIIEFIKNDTTNTKIQYTYKRSITTTPGSTHAGYLWISNNNIYILESLSQDVTGMENIVNSFTTFE